MEGVPTNTMKWLEFKWKGQKYRIYHDTTDEAINNILSEEFIDQYYKKGLSWIKKVKNPVVIDIGAFVGDSILYFNKAKGVTIYGLEPSQSSFQCLAMTTKGMDNVTIFNNGIMNETQIMKLDIGRTPGSGGASIYEYDSGSEDISVIGIDTFMEKLNINHVDLLKIDAEGAEYEIFGGPAFAKVCHKIDAIIGEAHLKPALPIIAQKQLEMLGYKFEWLPFKNYHYAWHMDGDNYHKRVETDLSTIFFAHR